MKDLGPASQYLNMRIQRDRVYKIYIIDQLAYIDCILDKYNLTKYSNPSPIPMGVMKFQKNEDQAFNKDIV